MPLWATETQAAGQKVLKGHVPAAAREQAALGDLPGATRMDLAIGLAVPRQRELTNFIAQLYDPASPLFHHYLTPAEFAERFAPSQADYDRVARFAEEHGLTVTRRHSNRLVLDVSGPVGSVEKAFQVKMRRYRHPTESRNFYAPDREPSIDADVPALEINGLNNYVTAHPSSLRRRSLAPGKAGPKPAAGSGHGGTYLGKDLRNAYIPNVTLDGTGQKVALFELDGYYASDIATYEALAGLGSVPLTNVLIDGFSGIPSGNAGFVSEVSLDIEMAVAMATNLSSVIVYEGGTTNFSLAEVVDILSRIATDDQAKQISSSWSWGGGTNAAVDTIFSEYQTQGQSFFEASGDSGAYRGTNLVEAPSDDAYVTVVGGTTLTTGTGGAWSSEVVWSWFPRQADASSGGVSLVFPIPSWQQSVDMSGNQGSTKKRNIPDVALTADNIFVVYNNGSEAEFGGTSCAAPLWAAFTAMVNQHALAHGESTVGFINPAVYSIGLGSGYTTAFHDITSGNNTNEASTTKYMAATGYDLCTGWGTPNGTNMVNALASQLPTITPNLNWPEASSVVYGTAMGAGLLAATTNTPGVLTYTPGAGTVLGVGTHSVSAVFRPRDTYDFNAVTNTANLAVTTAPLTVTANDATRVYGEANPTLSVNYSGFVNGEGVGVLGGSPNVATTATATSPPGVYEIDVSTGTLSANNYSFALVNGQLTVLAASTTTTVGSSASPALVGGAVTFTANVSAVSPGSGMPTGSVQFYADGVALEGTATLAAGAASVTTVSLAAGAHTITAQYSGDSNFNGSTGALTGSEMIYSAPAGTTVVLTRAAASGAKIKVASLLTAQSGANTGTLTLVSTDAESTNGGGVSVNNNWVFYTPLAGFTNDDEFSYVVQDSVGAHFTETVLVTAPGDASQAQNIISVTPLGGNTSAIQFQGAPGRSYTIQYSESLTPAAWQTVGSSTADAVGSFSFTNTPPNGSPAGFYRSTYP